MISNKIIFIISIQFQVHAVAQVLWCLPMTCKSSFESNITISKKRHVFGMIYSSRQQVSPEESPILTKEKTSEVFDLLWFCVTSTNTLLPASWEKDSGPSIRFKASNILFGDFDPWIWYLYFCTLYLNVCNKVPIYAVKHPRSLMKTVENPAK